MITNLVFLVVAYFLGSLPNGLYVAKFKGVNIMEEGSKNTGATNVFRVLGAKYGIFVLLLDALKGYIPLFVASKLGVNGNGLVLVGSYWPYFFSFFKI